MGFGCRVVWVGFRVQGLGCSVGAGFLGLVRDQDHEFKVQVLGLGLRVQGFGGWCRICGGSVYLGIPATLDLLDNVRLIQGLGLGAWGLGFGVKAVGFWEKVLEFGD